MTLVNPKPSLWVAQETLTAAQMNSVGTQLPYALDGNAGGSYTPSAQISLLGTGGGAGSALNLAGFPTVTSQTVSRIQPLTPLPTDTDFFPDDWRFDRGGGYWTCVDAGTYIIFPISVVPDLSVLTAVKLSVSGSDTGATADLYKDDNAGSITLLETQADSGGPSFRTLTITVNPTMSIDQAAAPRAAYVYVRGTVATYKIHRLVCDFTVTRLTP